MDLYRIFKTAEQLYATAPRYLGFLNGRALPPLQVVFELTYRCNLTCKFCYLQREQKNLGVEYSRDELTTTEIKGIVDQTPPWTLVIFSGGEIFIRKDIMELLEYTTRKRRCHVVTNGTYITPEIAERLVDLGLTSVGISIEGREEVHDSVRGRKTFAKSTAAIRTLAEQKNKKGKRFPLLNVKTTITEGNADHLADIVDLTKDLNANYCSYQIMNTSMMIGGQYLNDRLDVYRQAPPRIENISLETLSQQLSLVKEKALSSHVRARFSPDLTSDQMLEHYANQMKMSDYRCAAPWTGMNISAQGKVFPCFNYEIGDIRQHSLMSLWNGERFRAFRLSLIRDGLFAGCQGCCDLTPISHHTQMFSPTN